MRNQPGCTYGKHKWTKGVTKAKCRFDHFDNPKLLTLNIYAKNSSPGDCSFEANSCKLRVRVVYGVDRQEFEREFDLFGTIDPRLVYTSFIFSPPSLTSSLKKNDFYRCQSRNILFIILFAPPLVTKSTNNIGWFYSLNFLIVM